MKRYLITRHGANTANQSMTPSMDVCIVAATNADEAVEKAAERINCYFNQHLSAIHENSAPRRTGDFEWTNRDVLDFDDDGSAWPNAWRWAY